MTSLGKYMILFFEQKNKKYNKRSVGNVLHNQPRAITVYYKILGFQAERKKGEAV